MLTHYPSGRCTNNGQGYLYKLCKFPKLYRRKLILCNGILLLPVKSSSTTQIFWPDTLRAKTTTNIALFISSYIKSFINLCMICPILIVFWLKLDESEVHFVVLLDVLVHIVAFPVNSSPRWVQFVEQLIPRHEATVVCNTLELHILSLIHIWRCRR